MTHKHNMESHGDDGLRRGQMGLGGRSEAENKFCVPQIGLRIWAPFKDSFFFEEKFFFISGTGAGGLTGVVQGPKCPREVLGQWSGRAGRAGRSRSLGNGLEGLAELISWSCPPLGSEGRVSTSMHGAPAEDHKETACGAMRRLRSTPRVSVLNGSSLRTWSNGDTPPPPPPPPTTSRSF